MPYTSPIELLGYIAGVISAVAFLPQVFKVFNGENIKGLSLEMYTLYFISLVLWAVYAYLIDAHALLLTEAVTGIMVSYIIFKIIKKTL